MAPTQTNGWVGSLTSFLPVVFGWFLVHSRNVLRHFNLGRTALCPTRLFQHNRTTPVEGDYFCLGFGETKGVFVPHKSPRARKPYAKREIWKLSVNPHDDDVAVTAKALDGVDLWMDPMVWKAFFLSDRLVKALKSAKLTRRMGLRRCRVIEIH